MTSHVDSQPPFPSCRRALLKICRRHHWNGWFFYIIFRYLADGRGLRSVMAAQNMVNGRPMHCNKRLLTTILREEWGVKSVLVESDGGDCIGALQYGFHAAASIEEAAIISLESGMFVRSSFCFLFSFFGVSWSFKTAGYVLTHCLSTTYLVM